MSEFVVIQVKVTSEQRNLDQEYSQSLHVFS